MTPTPDEDASALGKAKQHLEAALKTVRFVKWENLTNSDRKRLREALKESERAVSALQEVVG